MPSGISVPGLPNAAATAFQSVGAARLARADNATMPNKAVAIAFLNMRALHCLDCPCNEVVDDTCAAACRKHRDHSYLEAEDRDHRGCRDRQRRPVDGGPNWNAEAHPESMRLNDLSEQGVQGEPDSEVQDNADDGGGNGGKRRVQ